ncbi:MAG: VWA domain-containing protein [Leptolyngbya sp.]|nr:VWA domain-containing protein [Candidatus Melainabacteria bacterium]
MTMSQEQNERTRRWRLLLGGEESEGTGYELDSADMEIDAALSWLYNRSQNNSEKSAGLGKSSPHVARWLGDIRKYFPSSVVQVMQKDALEKLNLKQMLMEPELLSTLEADVHLVANLVALRAALPNKTKDTARMVVRKVVDDLMRKLANPTRQAILGALSRSHRNQRPRHNEIDWNRTIRANLKNYQHEYKTIIPVTKYGFGRKRSSLKDIILCVDQSGSMATSVVYSSIFAAVLASMPALSTRLVVFDTAIVDLSEKLVDPVEVIFGTQLGGGTDINRALSYCQGLVRNPNDTILILISDLYEGGNNADMLKRAANIINSGVQFVSLLALSDDGAPISDTKNAAALAGMGSPAFACTPDLFPDLMAAVIAKRDINQWAATNKIVTSRA